MEKTFAVFLSAILDNGFWVVTGVLLLVVIFTALWKLAFNPFKTIEYIRKYLKNKKQSKKDELQVTTISQTEQAFASRLKEENEKEALSVTGYTKRERKIRVAELREDINVIGNLNRWSRRFEMESTFDIFTTGEHSTEDIEKRIWNAKVWAKNKVDTFSFGMDKIMDDFEKCYTEYGDNYYHYLSFEYWEKVVLNGVDEYNKKCIMMGMNKNFLKKISDKHESSIQYVLSEIKRTLKTRIFKNDPIIIVEVIFNSFQTAFDEAFKHLDEIITLNGEVSKILENWKIPAITLSEELDAEINNISFDD